MFFLGLLVYGHSPSESKENGVKKPARGCHGQRQAKGCKQTGKGQKRQAIRKLGREAIKGARKNGHEAAKSTGKGA